MRFLSKYFACLLICLAFTVAALADIDENTVGIWMFDEGAADEAKDLTDNHNDGVIEGDFVILGIAIIVERNGANCHLMIERCIHVA